MTGYRTFHRSGFSQGHRLHLWVPGAGSGEAKFQTSRGFLSQRQEFAWVRLNPLHPAFSILVPLGLYVSEVERLGREGVQLGAISVALRF